ncbi:hypothetical protein B0O80DRAFT_457897 [Mortierella sp. GBAus27b]|nr:hypothetical protein B0O80DRAFT_457897 [Mortierella sp. GBAus27b]
MIPRSHSFKDHWQEWFHGFNGGPSIWCLDTAFNNTWRSGSKSVAQLYKYKRQIVESGLRAMLAIDARTLIERQNIMFELILGKISEAGSLNKYYEGLPKGPAKAPPGPRPRKTKR